MSRDWTPEGVDRAMAAMRAVLDDETTLGDDAKIGRILTSFEVGGYVEIDASLTKSGRPELVQADPSWFVEVSE